MRRTAELLLSKYSIPEMRNGLSERNGRNMADDQDRFNEIFAQHDRAAAQSAPKSAAPRKAPEPERPERDFQPVRRERQSRSGCLGGLLYFVFVISVSVIIACLGWMAATDVLALNKGDETAVVTLPDTIFTTTTDSKGNKVTEADINYVATALKDAGIIEYKGLFKMYCNISDAKDKIDKGSYELSTTYDYRALVKKMQTGSNAMLTTKVTIPEGYTMEKIFRTLEDKGVCSYNDLMEAAANYDFNYSFLDADKKGSASRLEGYLFPDTYEFYTGMEPSSAIDKMLENFREKMTAEMLEQAENSGYKLSGAITIASMIEKEAANDDERAVIASVIYNRLKADMPLGVDSTSLYTHQDHDGAPTDEMLADASDAYNTRLNKGLTPTAICSPGIKSIRAALQPSDTKYYYYALDTATGTHKFFKTAGEFNAFVATQNYAQ
jgi:UPF0755 protein